MNRYLTAVCMFLAAAMPWMQSAQAQTPSATPPAPIEAFYCKMQPGKSMKDVMQVAQRFSKWADKNAKDYSAWILTPQFAQFEEVPQLIWLGSNSSGNQMGKTLDAYQASGGDIQKDFDDVISCGGHALASSIEINAPDGSPGNGVVMFTECNLADGSDRKKAVGASKKYSAAMRSMGAKNSNWMFFPMLGGREDIDFDYWGVATFNNWSDYFAAYEIYVNGGGWQKGMEIMNGVASCGETTPTVWDVKLVRSGAS
jgi:hypothetical protein